MNRKSASIFAQNARNVSVYLSTRPEFCKIGLRGAGAATEPDGQPFLSGKKSTCQKRNSEGCCIKQGY